MVVGGAAGLASGQASRLVNVTYDELSRSKFGQGFDLGRLFREASDAGVLKGESMLIDTASGTVSAGFGYGLVRLAVGTRLIQDPKVMAYLEQLSEMRQIVYDVKSKQWAFELAGTRITMDQAAFQTLINRVGRKMASELIDFLATLTGLETTEFLEKLKQDLEGQANAAP